MSSGISAPVNTSSLTVLVLSKLGDEAPGEAESIRYMYALGIAPPRHIETPLKTILFVKLLALVTVQQRQRRILAPVPSEAVLRMNANAWYLLLIG